MQSKYERLTVPTQTGYEADPQGALERLGRLEDRISKLQDEYRKTLAALETLKGKEKTATYRQLKANKLTLEELFLRMGL